MVAVASPSTGRLVRQGAEHVENEIAPTRLLRFNAIVSGITTGTIAGAAVFLATIWLVLKGGEVVGPHLSLLGQFFIGYEVSVGGSVVGAAYGFVGGLLLGWFVAALYNWLVDLKSPHRYGT